MCFRMAMLKTFKIGKIGTRSPVFHFTSSALERCATWTWRLQVYVAQRCRTGDVQVVGSGSGLLSHLGIISLILNKYRMGAWMFPVELFKWFANESKGPSPGEPTSDLKMSTVLSNCLINLHTLWVFDKPLNDHGSKVLHDNIINLEILMHVRTSACTANESETRLIRCRVVCWQSRNNHGCWGPPQWDIWLVL